MVSNICNYSHLIIIGRLIGKRGRRWHGEQSAARSDTSLLDPRPKCVPCVRACVLPCVCDGVCVFVRASVRTCVRANVRARARVQDFLRSWLARLLAPSSYGRHRASIKAVLNERQTGVKLVFTIIESVLNEH